MYSGKRSKEAQQRREQKRAAQQYVISLSFQDRLIHEVVCRTEPDEIQTFLGQQFGYCDMSAVPIVFSGVVLQNDYGHGVFQNEI